MGLNAFQERSFHCCSSAECQDSRSLIEAFLNTIYFYNYPGGPSPLVRMYHSAILYELPALQGQKEGLLSQAMTPVP